MYNFYFSFINSSLILSKAVSKEAITFPCSVSIITSPSFKEISSITNISPL
ncbi:hypothetical protein H04402_02755 [Clostridium botulinum H04402 065]|nr:hypothetical protein H04402_02755 [Clostridium botulinum H04402 065]